MCFFCVSYFEESIRQKMLESSEVKMYQTILFDLDGTITDSGSGIMRSILYATEQLGWPDPSEETLRSFIGPPLYESFLHMAPSAEAAQQAVVIIERIIREKVCLKTMCIQDSRSVNKVKGSGSKVIHCDFQARRIC